jgi:hypothetical protein
MEKESEQNQTSSITQKTFLDYKEFEKNYSRELLIMDCLDWIKDRPYDAKEILDHLEYCSSIEKTSEEFHQMDQVL